MKIGIDASNLRAGGGMTHLVSLLSAAEPSDHGVDSVVIWGSEKTLERIEDRPWLTKRHDAVLEKNALRRAWWQRTRLTELLRESRCDLLFAPGGTVLSSFRPAVTMSQNLLPFEWPELRRYGSSLKTLRLLTLRWSQSRSFRRSTGVIFLTEYAKSAVLAVTGPLDAATAIVPHGVDDRFRSASASQRTGGVRGVPPTFVYVSPFEPYKHQQKVMQAASAVRQRGLDIKMRFVGPAGKSFGDFEARRQEIDPAGTFVEVVKGVPFSDMPSIYHRADIFLFASSCENMPNILLEAMAAGLPIICSRMGPMPEVLGDAGRYFDPESAESIEAAMYEMATSSSMQIEMAQAAHERAKPFTWARCAHETFDFLAHVARKQETIQKFSKLPPETQKAPLSPA